MSDPEVIGDRERYAEAGRAVQPARARRASSPRSGGSRSRDAEGAQELLDEGGEDAEMRAELDEARERIERLEEEIRLAMVERDPNDDKNVIVEIRARRGRRRGRPVGRRPLPDAHPLRRAARLQDRDAGSASATAPYTFEVKGDGAYSVFKFEGGTHRVQRVPETESQGRIHTSTATVAVLPEAEEVDVEIDQNDLQIDVYRSSGPGGQSVNTTDSAVRITHKPTGIVVSMQDEKSQLQNRERAMQGAARAAYERELAEQQAELAAERKRPGRHRRARGEDPHLQLPPAAASPTTAIKLTVHNLDAGARRASSTSSPPRCRTPRSASGSEAAGRRGLSAAARSRSTHGPRRARLARSIALAAAGVRRRRGSTPSCCSRDATGRRPRGADRRPGRAS